MTIIVGFGLVMWFCLSCYLVKHVNMSIFCAHSRMMSGGTLNWKMWVFNLFWDTYSKMFFIHRVEMLSYFFCREWLCWWWVQLMHCLRSLLSGPCLWRTWLRSSWPQRWVSLKMTRMGKTNMVMAVLCTDVTHAACFYPLIKNLIMFYYCHEVSSQLKNKVCKLKMSLKTKSRNVMFDKVPIKLQLRTNIFTENWFNERTPNEVNVPEGMCLTLFICRWSCLAAWQTWATLVTWTPQCSVCALCRSWRPHSEGGFSALLTVNILMCRTLHIKRNFLCFWGFALAKIFLLHL